MVTSTSLVQKVQPKKKRQIYSGDELKVPFWLNVDSLFKKMKDTAFSLYFYREDDRKD